MRTKKQKYQQYDLEKFNKVQKQQDVFEPYVLPKAKVDGEESNGPKNISIYFEARSPEKCITVANVLAQYDCCTRVTHTKCKDPGCRNWIIEVACPDAYVARLGMLNILTQMSLFAKAQGITFNGWLPGSRSGEALTESVPNALIDRAEPTQPSHSSMEGQSWALVNAEEYAAKYKYTFRRVSNKEARAVKVGNLVWMNLKLLVPRPNEISSECMWFKVEANDGQGNCKGRLLDSPIHVRDLKKGDSIPFRDVNVIGRGDYDDEPYPRQIDGGSIPAGYIFENYIGVVGPYDSPDAFAQYRRNCFVSHSVWHGVEIGGLLRDPPVGKFDSGWVMYAPGEDIKDVFKAKHVHCVTLGEMLNRDESILPLLDAPAGARFVRQVENGQFKPNASNE